MKLLALLTSHNRKENTIKCLHALENAATGAGVEINAILVDDGSTDGTGDSVRSQFAWVKVVDGDGSLYWNRGMHKAHQCAEGEDYDFIVWINDDTFLTYDSLKELLGVSQSVFNSDKKWPIVVGVSADPDSNNVTYTGQVRVSRFRPFAYKKVHSNSEIIDCCAMNGNLVLIHREIITKVGNLNPIFEHAMGDMDYSLRAIKKGIRVIVAPGIHALCKENSPKGSYADKTLSFRMRWKLITDKKGLPIQSWYVFTKEHGGKFWPVHFSWPYIKLILTSIF